MHGTIGVGERERCIDVVVCCVLSKEEGKNGGWKATGFSVVLKVA